MKGQTVTRPPREALDIQESAAGLVESVSGSPIQPDGTVLLHIIRPTVGRGKGSHLYEAGMLEKHAHIFGPHTKPDGSRTKGWKMYVNHLSEAARKAKGGLPRDMQDLGGRIVESWWDPNVPAEGRFGQGAVVGRAKPTPFVRELIENDPEIVEASISATATGVRKGRQGNQNVWIVEGIADHGSVDWVTEAGAGGRVVALMEAAIDRFEQESDLSSLDDEAFMDHLRTARPHLAEALGASEEDDMGITPEMLTEALQSAEGRAVLDTIVEERVQARLQESVTTLVESALSDERDLIRAEARADADRQIALRDMRDEAHRMIEEAGRRWPERLVQDAKAKFTLVEGNPSDDLDVIDVIDDEGNVAKRAHEVLRESVHAEITRQQEILAAVRPTRVTGQGETRIQESSDEGGNKDEAKDTLYGAVLSEAGIDPNQAYAQS